MDGILNHIHTWRPTGTTDEFVLVTNSVRWRQRTGHCWGGGERGWWSARVLNWPRAKQWHGKLKPFYALFPSHWTFTCTTRRNSFHFIFLLRHSMEGLDICFEVVRRANAGFVYSEAVIWWVNGVGGGLLGTLLNKGDSEDLLRVMGCGCGSAQVLMCVMCVCLFRLPAIICAKYWRRWGTATRTTSSTGIYDRPAHYWPAKTTQRPSSSAVSDLRCSCPTEGITLIPEVSARVVFLIQRISALSENLKQNRLGTFSAANHQLVVIKSILKWLERCLLLETRWP